MSYNKYSFIKLIIIILNKAYININKFINK
jgi:hypothetical protein